MSRLNTHQNSSRLELIEYIVEKLRNNERPTRLQLEKKGRELGITDKRLVKELIEFSVLLYGREIIKGEPVYSAYNRLVKLYNNQPNSSYRSSQVEILRQYSTPLPISYLLGVFVGGKDKSKLFLEPSAGNGLLTIGLPPEKTHVNELDELRFSILKEKQARFWGTTNENAEHGLREVWQNYDGVISNPPFGRLKEDYMFNGIPLKFMDHYLMIRALEGMKDNGRAAFVTGAHMKFDRKGRITVGHGRYFFSYLFSHFNVVDMIPIDGNALYIKQGTGMDTMLILINGRKSVPEGSAPIESNFDKTIIDNHKDLYKRIQKHFPMQQRKTSIKKRAEELAARLRNSTELGAPYVPTSDSCIVLDTETPDTMAFEMHNAMATIKKAVGGDIDNFVRHRLGYRSKLHLCNSLAAEQTDAVAMAIYNIEAKKQGCIIGDQTGIGKGRVAAAIIRYAVKQGLKPIFLTEKANLFSDLYRDLKAIGSGTMRPFIVNAKESKTNVKDEHGKVLFSADSKAKQELIFRSGNLDDYDFVMATYSQFNSATKQLKREFLLNIAKDSIVVMDESHNASGSSQTGVFIRKVVRDTRSTIFLSATFAKRPDNMPVYAIKTGISDANMSPDQFIWAVQRGGVALQEILASQLVAEGQMIRRERSYDGVKVEYRTLEKKQAEHFAIADNITKIMRDIIVFQRKYISPLIEEIDLKLAKENKEIRQRGGTSDLGISNISYFSKIFNIINQMLFAIKAEDVADAAIAKLKEGKKPIIAFSSTMGSFLSQIVEENEIVVGEGDPINTDFTLILKNGLDGVMRYTMVDDMGEKHYHVFDKNDLSMEAIGEYWRIMGQIESAISGVFISPIDIILDKIQDAGYSVLEVTGRTLRVKYKSGMKSGTIEKRRRVNVNDAFSSFNNNETDVLLINQSGATGASAQAMVTPKVPLEQVKPRVMIVLQMELNIDTEVQKRGRIFRTGQVHAPEYLYINSAIPAEKRMMMMLSQKLKSLDANTSSNQNQNKKMMDGADFLNKYGDRIVTDYLLENGKLHRDLGKPALGSEGGATAHRVSGRVAVMPTHVQDEFYNEITTQYIEYVDYLRQVGDYDLEVEELNLQATTLKKKIAVVGNGGFSKFGTDTYLEKVEVNALKKPYKGSEIQNLVLQTLDGKSQQEYIDKLIGDYDTFTIPKYEAEKSEIETTYNDRIKALPKEKRLLKLWEKEGEEAYAQFLDEETQRLEGVRDDRLSSLETKFRGNKQVFYGNVKFFKVGCALNYTPFIGSDTVFATFLGFEINPKAKNPYAKSAVKLKFAIASHLKSLLLPSSFDYEINAIKGASLEAGKLTIEEMLLQWDHEVKNKRHDRIIRYMKTGNLVQGFSGGRLVSYTTEKGTVEKGVLIYEDKEPENMDAEGIIVPLLRAKSYIQSEANRRHVMLSEKISIRNNGEVYEMRVPSSKKHGSKFFMDEELIAFTIDGKFEKVSDTMRGHIVESKLDKLLEFLAQKYGVNIELSLAEFDRLKEVTIEKSKKIAKIKLPDDSEQNMNIVVARAKAISLKLRLLKKLNRAG